MIAEFCGTAALVTAYVAITCHRTKDLSNEPEQGRLEV
jgi:hypothetical protein